MNTTTVKLFDINDFIKKSKELGVSEQVAELQAQQIQVLANTQQEQSQAIASINQTDPIIKKDFGILKLEILKEIEILRKEISNVRYDALKFTVWTGAAVILTLGGNAS